MQRLGHPVSICPDCGGVRWDDPDGRTRHAARCGELADCDHPAAAPAEPWDTGTVLSQDKTMLLCPACGALEQMMYEAIAPAIS